MGQKMDQMKILNQLRKAQKELKNEIFEVEAVDGAVASLADNPYLEQLIKEYEKLGIEPLEFSLRDQVGIRIDPKNMDTLETELAQLLRSKEQYAGRIENIRNTYIANFGHSGEVGGRYILGALKARQKAKKETVS